MLGGGFHVERRPNSVMEGGCSAVCRDQDRSQHFLESILRSEEEIKRMAAKIDSSFEDNLSPGVDCFTLTPDNVLD
jgi:uncharacterized protein (UPF0335 family)